MNYCISWKSWLWYTCKSKVKVVRLFLLSNMNIYLYFIYMFILIFIFRISYWLKLGSGVGWCEPERRIVATRWSLEAKERP